MAVGDVCCGREDMTKAAAMAAVEEPMERTHRVFTATPGDVRQIGNYGTASNDEPALVPLSVAEELASTSLFRVETIDAATPKLTAAALKKAQPRRED